MIAFLHLDLWVNCTLVVYSKEKDVICLKACFYIGVKLQLVVYIKRTGNDLSPFMDAG